MTLNDLWPGFQGEDIFWSRQDKVTIAQEEKYLTYGMVAY